ncbi:MAG: tRNA (adenosine(37)-N6)-threonylcarbamoyltransferase complex ATPase subunit type 1 TsaE [Deltaproteobacteria bacterium]|nr:MAG: tRNA (adenosine(37)-N6)-threonylcarbamoyltransferase complex ATPase subunit type 1 TsaE [Deltaproteobacteria bacterium]
MRERLVCATEAQTLALGVALGSDAFAGMVVCLNGPLGAGKTVLTRGLARGLGLSGTISSPTYQLVAIYEGGRLPLWHADLYRLPEGADLQDLALDHAMEGVLVVEWAERSPEELPSEHLWVDLEILSHGRALTFQARGRHYHATVERLGDLRR